MGWSTRSIRFVVASTLACAGCWSGWAGLQEVPPAAAGTTTVSATLAEDDTPLHVEIDSLVPGTVPTSGPVRVTGSVTNNDDVTWRDINTYAVFGEQPFTTSQEVAAAVDTPAEDFIGERITDPGTEDRIDSLAPGEALGFTVNVPRSLLDTSGGPGVYWFAVHALGSSDESPRDGFADGRARTFLPFVPPREAAREPVDVAVVIPLRRRVAYTPIGRIADVQGWERALSPGARLRNLVDFGAAAGDTEVSWLIDPGLPDAVRRLAAGNPSRSIAPSPGLRDGDVEPDPTVPSSGPDPSESADPPEELPSEQPLEDTEEPAPDDAPQQTDLPPELSDQASLWLGRLRQALRGNDVLALPYGDLDVTAAAAGHPRLIRTAQRAESRVLSDFGIETVPAVGEPSGALGPQVYPELDENTLVLLEEFLLREAADGEPVPSATTVADRRTLVTAAAAAVGGPGPADPLSTVNLRQRLLSEAAIRSLTSNDADAPDPLVWTIPAGFKGEDGLGFFAGLDEDWLDVVPASQLSGDAATTTGETFDAPEYPDGLQARLVSSSRLDLAADLIDRGTVLEALLTRNDRVGRILTEQALAGVSIGTRFDATDAAARLRGATGWTETRLERITVTVPPGVTLSGESGEFGATINNRLPEPVRVRLIARGDDDKVRITPGEAVDIPARGRASVNLEAVVSDTQVHRVQVLLTDQRGRPLGTTAELPVRTVGVSNLIWVVVGLGAALLVVRFGRRIRQGLHSRGHTPTEPEHPDPTTQPQPQDQAT